MNDDLSFTFCCFLDTLRGGDLKSMFENGEGISVQTTKFGFQKMRD